MIKSVLVALTLVTASVGGAFAGQRTINVWGAQLNVPGEQVEASSFAPRLDERGGARFMSAPVRDSSATVHPSNGYHEIEHAR